MQLRNRSGMPGRMARNRRFPEEVHDDGRRTTKAAIDPGQVTSPDQNVLAFGRPHPSAIGTYDRAVPPISCPAPNRAAAHRVGTSRFVPTTCPEQQFPAGHSGHHRIHRTATHSTVVWYVNGTLQSLRIDKAIRWIARRIERAAKAQEHESRHDIVVPHIDVERPSDVRARGVCADRRWVWTGRHSRRDDRLGLDAITGQRRRAVRLHHDFELAGSRPRHRIHRGGPR